MPSKKKKREKKGSRLCSRGTYLMRYVLENPLDFKEIKPVNPKGNQSWIFIGRTDGETETPVLWPPNVKNCLIGKDPDAGKDWMWEEKGTTEGEMVEWHHWLDGHGFEQALGVGDGQASLAWSSPWGRKESDMTEQLNWTQPDEGPASWQMTGGPQVNCGLAFVSLIKRKWGYLLSPRIFLLLHPELTHFPLRFLMCIRVSVSLLWLPQLSPLTWIWKGVLHSHCAWSPGETRTQCPSPEIAIIWLRLWPWCQYILKVLQGILMSPWSLFCSRDRFGYFLLTHRNERNWGKNNME